MRGEDVLIELTSLNATSGVALSLSTPNGEARPLTSTERLVIHDLLITASSGGQSGVGRFELFQNFGSSNRRMVIVTGGGQQTPLNVMINFGLDGQPGFRGVMPKLVGTTAGYVSVTGRGGVESL